MKYIGGVKKIKTLKSFLPRTRKLEERARVIYNKNIIKLTNSMCTFGILKQMYPYTLIKRENV